MKKLIYFSVSCICAWSTLAIADSNIIDIPVDAYLEDNTNFKPEPDRVPVPSQEPALIYDNSLQEAAEAGSTTSQPVYISEEIIIDDSVPVQAANPDAVSPEVVTIETTENAPIEEFEIIELESYNEDVVTVEAKKPNVTNEPNVSNVATATTSPHAYCQKTPLAKECLYSDYVTSCKKDPQSAQCDSQIKQFNNFCNTFPNAYKCKKAKLTAACQTQPSLAECKPFTERYCQRFPKAVFCDWN